MIYIEVIDGEITRSTQFKDIAKNYKNVITTDFGDYTPNNIKYVFDGEKIISNPDFETEKEKQEKIQRKAEILEELDSIDLKTIRALRANDTEYIEQYEEQAKVLREELSSL